jgi:tryptophan 2,3-dioxygenase
MLGTYYGDYLGLKNLLNSQHPKSNAHDETLFIIVHQAYELWFKQILHEINSIGSIMSKPQIEEGQMGVVVHRLERIVEIQKVLLDQLKIMETMTPLDFMDFRDQLYPASGFQSIQFRLIEMKLGLKLKDRIHYAKTMFLNRLKEEDQKILLQEEEAKSLVDYLDQWLARFPLMSDLSFTFWQDYHKVVDEMLKNDRMMIENNPLLSEEEKEANVKNWEATKETFKSFFDENKHAELKKLKKRQFSHKALQTALFISLYRDEPLLAMPFKILTRLIDIDENFTTWRYRHALMAHRLLGTKIGTGGSSGHEYLKIAADNNRVFTDLYNISTFLIPRSKLPKLKQEWKEKLNF